jgi:hypothetical protein
MAFSIFSLEVQNMHLRNMHIRESAIQKIIAFCPDYKREEIEDLLDEWAEIRRLDFHDFVPEGEVDTLIEVLHEEIKHAA